MKHMSYGYIIKSRFFFYISGCIHLLGMYNPEK